MHQFSLSQHNISNPPFYLRVMREKGAESNCSRLARLCWKYRIPPTIFFNKFLKNGAPITRKFFKFEVASHMNSYTDKTVTYERKFNQLLGESDNRCFSYSYLNSALDGNARGFLFPTKRWCPECYRGRRVSGQDENGVFDDLYWSVDSIKTCLLHGCTLSTKCKQCFHVQPYISTVVEPGFCHNCLSFLGDGHDPCISEEELEHQRRLFTLFYVDTYEEIRPSFQLLADNLKALKRAYPEASSKYLGDAMGVSDDVVKKWISGKRRPQLASLYQLQKVLGLYGPHQLFYKTDLFLNKVFLSKALSLKFNRRSEFADVLKDAEIRSCFDDMIRGKEFTISRSDFAQRFGVSEGLLMSRYSQLCEQLSVAHQNRLTREKELKQKDLIQQLSLALGRVRSRRKTWTLDNTIAELKDPALVEGDSYGELWILFQKAKLLMGVRDERRRQKKKARKWAN